LTWPRYGRPQSTRPGLRFPTPSVLELHGLPNPGTFASPSEAAKAPRSIHPWDAQGASFQRGNVAHLFYSLRAIQGASQLFDGRPKTLDERA
jgi:hypothetical protein